MRRKNIISIVLLSALFLAAIPLAVGDEKSYPFAKNDIAYSVTPVKYHEISNVEASMQVDPVPWNIDIIDAEATSNDGEGIYVAVLDTGLLSNYLHFFPESMVDIKEEWGKGFTHDVFYVGTGGNWSADGKFSYSPIKDDRGFITYDYGNPLWTFYPPAHTYYPYPFGNGHGTHVTSIITGYHFEIGTVDTWIAGAVPKVTIIPVLVLDDWIVYEPDSSNGSWWSGGTDEMVAAGIEYVGARARVLLNS